MPANRSRSNVWTPTVDYCPLSTALSKGMEESMDGREGQGRGRGMGREGMRRQGALKMQDQKMQDLKMKDLLGMRRAFADTVSICEELIL